MSPFSVSLARLVPLVLLAASAAAAGPSLEVSGEVVATAPRLEIRVTIANPGERATGPLDVVGELLGERREARVTAGVPPAGRSAVVLDFDTSLARPGLHALVLLLEHPVEGPPDAAGSPPVESRRAWLLVALGARAEPAVRIEAEPLSLDVRGELAVSLASADGEPHRVQLRVFTARGLRPEGRGSEVKVPAQGAVQLRLPIVRAAAPRGTRHGVLVVAEALDGPLARTAVATATVEVAPDPSLLPRMRGALLVLGLLLLALAAGAEWRHRRRPRGP